MTPGTRVYKTGSPVDYTTGRTGVVVGLGTGRGVDKALVKWDENGKETWVQIGGYRGVHEIPKNGVISHGGNSVQNTDVLPKSAPTKYARKIVHPRFADKAAAEVVGSKDHKS